MMLHRGDSGSPPAHRSGCVLRCAGLACLLAASFGAWAAESAGNFPVRPVRWIVPYPAAGSIDLVARIIGNKLPGVWGQNVVIENHGGAGGRLGVQIVVAAAPDGYTQLLTLNSNYTIDRSSIKDLAYDPEKALTPVTIVASTAQYLIANPAFPVKNARELIALAKAKPNQINSGSTGPGGSLYLAMELFKWMAGIKITDIAYRGSVNAATDLVSGQVAIMFISAPAAVPYIKSGRVKALGISSSQRSPLLPDVPTIAESGLPGFNIEAWYGLSVPAGTAPAIVNKTYLDVTQVLKLPEVRKQLAAASADPVNLNPEETAQRIKAESATWAKLIQNSTIRFE